MRKPVFGVSETNQAIQPQLLMFDLGSRGIVLLVQTKVLICCMVTAQLRFSRDAAMVLKLRI